MEEYPANLNVLAHCKPIYEEMPGWNEDITGVQSIDELPEEARHYLKRVSELTGIPISIFSVGPDRKQTIVLNNIYE